MKQQLAASLRLVVRQVAVRVGRDVGVEEEGLAVFEDDVRVLDVRVPIPQVSATPASAFCRTK
jgi:hypothetical protein